MKTVHGFVQFTQRTGFATELGCPGMRGLDQSIDSRKDPYHDMAVRIYKPAMVAQELGHNNWRIGRASIDEGRLTIVVEN